MHLKNLVVLIILYFMILPPAWAGQTLKPTFANNNFSSHLGQFRDISVLGFDFFVTLGEDHYSEQSLDRKKGLRLDIDVLFIADVIYKDQSQKIDETGFRTSLYYLAYLQALSSPVWGYSGVGLEAIRVDGFWENHFGYGGNIIYGIEVDTWGIAKADEPNFRMFLEGIFHIGHERVEDLSAEPNLFLGTQFNMGIRVAFL